jgi:hypothetical protein
MHHLLFEGGHWQLIVLYTFLVIPAKAGMTGKVFWKNRPQSPAAHKCCKDMGTE